MTADSATPTTAVSGVILAGGFGSRLGRDKATALAAGRPLLYWTADALAAVADDLVLVARPGQQLPPPPPGLRWRITHDRRSESGPLAGIEAALALVRHDLALVVATDMPLLQAPLLRALVAACHGVDVVMPQRDGRVEPLLAVYRRDCLPAVRALLDAGERRPRMLLQRVSGLALPVDDLRPHDPDLLSFTNVNRPADLERVATLLAGRAPPQPPPNPPPPQSLSQPAEGGLP